MMAIFILVAMVSLCLVPVVCGAGEYTEQEVVERSVQFQPGGRLTLVNVNGGITIGSWDRDEVKVQAKKKAGVRSEEEARELLEKTEVRVDGTADRIDIRTELPRDLRGNRSVSVDYTLTVPKEIDLELESVNGGIRVNAVSGAIEAETTNGSIRFAEVQGAVQAETKNGSIRLSEIQGAIQASTENGRIEAAVSRRGQDEHEIRASTTNGSIEVALPRGFKARLKAATVNGHIKTDFPVTVKGRIGSKSVDGDINGGGRLVYLKTVNGSIRLREF